MKITIIFPKSGCYALKDLNEKRILKERFMKYLAIVKAAGCAVECLLEDTLAHDMLFDANIEPTKIVSCITQSDIGLLQQYDDIEDLEDYVFSSYPTVEHILFDTEKKYTVPLTALKEGKAAYIKRRVQNYRKSYSYCIGRYISECKNILQFRTGNSMDRGCAVSTTSKQGDGRLCVEVNMSNQTTSVYYGGVFIQEDMLPTILSL